ncbi:tRNA (N(6)-L-threonylcarbamoyladenosine(37)-C(2))-methylthiotransferase MtaB [Bacteroidia bacterium]|nr:tRNA (N(6)-L-threonylcarbamoyladenosine(37)-C(2))-methylthiotransferase MtaB [Bacteroidia bacterium]
MQEKNVDFISLGCRLNVLESEKITAMLENSGAFADTRALVINTCAVTGEAERQSKQAIRKIIRENPGALVFVTGCAVTRAPDEYAKIPGIARAIKNTDKFDISAYSDQLPVTSNQFPVSNLQYLSKGFVQIQNGCNHSCTYCIVSRLRGKNVSFPYDRILADVRALVENGYLEIVLTGVDIAGFRDADGGLDSLCTRLLRDVSGIARLRLSSLDPAAPLRPMQDLILRDARMAPHLHLSAQSASDPVLAAMGRRHSAARLMELCSYSDKISYSWDLICGFPGETQEMFDETVSVIRDSGVIRLHAFPFSPRPGTPAAEMPNQVPRAESKRRVAAATQIARENMTKFMAGQVGKTVSVLVEENNLGRDPDDIPVLITGAQVPPKSFVTIRLTGMSSGVSARFTGEGA